MRMYRVVEGGVYRNVVPRGLYGDVSGDPHMRQTGEIKITFAPNSLGHFLKNIDIVCNIDSGIMKLKLCGNVIE